MKILVLNCGSSSLKYQLVDMDGEKLLAKGLVERIGMAGSHIKHTKVAGKEKFDKDVSFPTHTEAIKFVLDMLVDKKFGVLKNLSELSAAGHRVVHGGEDFTESALVTPKVLEGIRKVTPLAPLHNPANLQGIEAVQKVLPDLPNVVLFDTSFHQTMPATSYLYGIPYEFYKKEKIRRYGFHGTSHKYVSQRCAELLGKPIKELRIITCHLGNGSSITAVKKGKSLDTTMGYSPTAGVIMGTRSGDVDPAVLIQLASLGYDVDKINEICNKKSGLLGISGVSSDLRDVEEAAEDNNWRAETAQNMLIYEVKKYIGAYAAAMGGVDAIVFTAGIGENGIAFREKVCKDLEFLGVKFDKNSNKVRGEEVLISKKRSPVKVFVIPTNEELMIARDTQRLVLGSAPAKKAAAKKTTAKRTAKKTAAKKTTAKRTAKKAAAKKTTAKRTTKKAAAKETTVKKTAVKKTAAAKKAGRKPAAKSAKKAK